MFTNEDDDDEVVLVTFFFFPKRFFGKLLLLLKTQEIDVAGSFDWKQFEIFFNPTLKRLSRLVLWTSIGIDQHKIFFNQFFRVINYQQFDFLKFLIKSLFFRKTNSFLTSQDSNKFNKICKNETKQIIKGKLSLEKSTLFTKTLIL